jgi:hypothetical protein
MASKGKKEKSPKPFYDQTLEIPYECEKCKHQGKVIRRVYSIKKVITEPVKAEYDIQHFVEPVSTVKDFVDGEKPKDEQEDEEKKEEDNPEEEEDASEGSDSMISDTLKDLDKDK